MDIVCWHRMQLPLPAQWAIVRHGVKSAGGRLVWIDRRDQRMQLAWLHAPSRPDIDRAMNDYRSVDLQQDASATFADMPELNGWVGMITTTTTQCFTRAVRYEPDVQRWIELTLTWPQQTRDISLEQKMLQGFVLQPSDENERWRAFGMDLSLTAVINDKGPSHLEQVMPLPADVRWKFLQPASGSEWIIRKVGMLESWFDGSLQEMLRRQRAEVALEIEPLLIQGHAGFVGVSALLQARITRLWRRRKQCVDVVWHCPQSRSVWQVTCMGFIGKEDRPWEAVVAHCCPRHSSSIVAEQIS